MLAVAGGAAAVALGGCLGDTAVTGNDTAGKSDGTGATAVGSSGKLGDPAEAVEVRLQSYPTPAVDPTLVHVVPGGTVEWVGAGIRNTTTAYHPETNGPQRIPDSAEPWDSGILRKDSRFTHTFEEAGIYDYADTTELCGSHESFGVVGRVVVGQPNLAAEPAIQHDVTTLPSLATDAMATLDRRCRNHFG